LRVAVSAVPVKFPADSSVVVPTTPPVPAICGNVEVNVYGKHFSRRVLVTDDPPLPALSCVDVGSAAPLIALIAENFAPELVESENPDA
jgi:hypothetical protein